MALEQIPHCPCNKYFEDVGVDADGNCQECMEPLDNHQPNPARFDTWLENKFGDARAQRRRIKSALLEANIENITELFNAIDGDTDKVSIANTLGRLLPMTPVDCNALAGKLLPKTGNLINLNLFLHIPALINSYFFLYSLPSNFVCY